MKRYLEADLKMGDTGRGSFNTSFAKRHCTTGCVLADQLAGIESDEWTAVAVRAGQKNLRHHQNRAYKDQLQRLRGT